MKRLYKRVALLHFLFFLSYFANAQELPYAWLNSMQPVSVQSAPPDMFPVYDTKSVKVDAAGNVYVTGYFNGTCDFDPGTGQNTLVESDADKEIFFAKYDKEGKLLFVKRIGATGENSTGIDIDINGSGKIILTGLFDISVTFDPDGSAQFFPSSGGTDIFVARFDGITGDYEDAFVLGGVSGDSPSELTVIGDDYYLTGSFQGLVDFDPGAGSTEIFAPNPTNFILKLSQFNTLQWVKQIGSYTLRSTAVTASGIHLAGGFTGTNDFDPSAGTFNMTSAGNSDAWLSKLDLNGNFLWAKRFGGLRRDEIYDIAIGSSNSVYVTGVFQGTVDMDPGAGSLPASSNSGSDDAFLSKFDSNGNLAWSKTWGGNLYEDGTSLVTLAPDRIVVAGNFTSPTLDLDPGAGTSSVSNNGNYDVAISHFSGNGTFVHGFSYGGSSPTNFDGGFLESNGDNLFVAWGTYSDAVDFDPSTAANGLTDLYYQQIYITSYGFLATQPTAQPTALNLTPTASSINGTFSAGAGMSGYLIIRKTGSAPTGVPRDGQKYIPGNAIGDATVVAVGSGRTFTDNVLASNKTYHYKVFSFNDVGGYQNYLTSTPLSNSATTSNQTYDRATDSLALIQLYNATMGTNWSNKTNWLVPTQPISTWYGVVMAGGRVTELLLNDNNLYGTLPESIGNLSSLKKLHLYNNFIEGSVPSSVFQIPTILEVNFHNNMFSGTIPDAIGSATNLTLLNLSINNLEGNIPDNVAALTKLMVLELFKNKLSGPIPSTIGQLTKLDVLDLSQNQLSGSIPATIGGLIELEYLHLYENNFTGSIPAELGSLNALVLLNLSFNELTGSIPTTFGGLTSLTNLYLSQNDLSGSIPSQLGSATNLVVAHFEGNSLTGALPSSFTGLTNLAELRITDNGISDLPNLSGLSNLGTFTVEFNALTFEDLEPNISKLTSYIPQNDVGDADTLYVNDGANVSFPIPVGGSANTYQWYKQNVLQSGQSTSTLTFVAKPDKIGPWQLRVTNAVVGGLIIRSQVVYVSVKSESMFTWADAGDLTNDGQDGNLYTGAWGDFDNDGYDDIVTMGVKAGKLYHNNGNGTFTRMTGAIENEIGRSAVWGDYNNDGFVDLFTPDMLFAGDATSDLLAAVYKNNKNGTFTKISLGQSAVSGSWVDLDADGDLDLAIENGAGGANTQILRNEGNDVFTPIDLLDRGTQWNSIWVDVNNDNRLDYFMPSPTTELNGSKLFMNYGLDDFEESGIYKPVYSGQPRGASFADIDNDGDYDLFNAIQSGQQSQFSINDGTGVFTDFNASDFLGESITSSRGSAFADFNNDGWVDLIINQGTNDPKGPTIYLNNGGTSFTRLPGQSFKSIDVTSGFSISDYDSDGHLDIFSSPFAGFTNGLYKNKGNGNHWVKLKLKGTVSNAMAIGAKVTVYAGGVGRHQQVLTVNGFANQNTNYLHFGLGASTSIDSVKIVWPTGRRQSVKDLAPDQLHEIQEPLNPQYEGDAELQVVKQIKNTSMEGGNKLSTFITLDAANNTYMINSFTGSVDVDPGAGELVFTASGNGSEGDYYVAKFDPSGTLIWAKQFSVGGAPNNDLELNVLEVDKDNNVLLGGGFIGTIDFNPDAGVNNLTGSSLTSPTGFFGKYNSNGQFVWVNRIAATGESTESTVAAIETDSNGEVIVTGNFSGFGGSIDVDPGAGTQTVNINGNSDVYLAKYDVNGAYKWHGNLSKPDGERSPHIALDASNNIYLTYLAQNAGSYTYVIQRYTAAGAADWLANSPGVDVDDNGRLFVEGGNLFAVGNYAGTTTFNGKSGSATLPGTTDGAYSSFVMKFDLAGSLQWAKGFPSYNYSTLYGLRSLASGDIILTGYFEGDMDLDPGLNDYVYNFVGQSTACIKLTSTGDFIWGFAIENSYGVHAITTTGEMIMAITMQSSTDVDPSQIENVVNSVGLDNTVWLKFKVATGVSTADRKILEAFYNATGGPKWTTNTNWLQGEVNTWHGVQVTNNKVVGIDLHDNNLTGNVPEDFYTLNEIETINLSGNMLRSIPNLSVIPGLTTLNVSNNKLDFGSLEPNLGVSSFSYQNQKPLGDPDTVLVDVGTAYNLTLNVGGTANNYGWKKNGSPVAGTNKTYPFSSVDKNSMGNYVMQITSNIITDLTLQTEPQSVFAVTKVSGQLLVEGEGAHGGVMRLLRVTTTGGYDTLRVASVNQDGTYLIDKVILDKYQLIGFADTVNHARALPTYYNNKLYWEEADQLLIEGEITGLDIESFMKPTDQPTGTALIDGYVVEQDESGRTKVAKRVGGAGTSVRRVEGSGRGKETLVLIAYEFTNEDGEFSFGDLEPGTYRLNIQYPGYPMDENSFIDITVGEGLEGHKRAEASVEEGKIVVRQLIITGISQHEGYSIDVYPNPSSEVINFKFPDESVNRGINLIDVKGSLLLNQSAEGREVKMNVRSLKPGIYFINVEENGKKLKSVRVEVK